jgi:hypothetical protein
MKMQKFKLRLTIPLLFTVMVLCMGCPYESKFPLEGTKVKYDKNLIGSWHQDETDLKIIRVDDYRFSYVYNDHDDDGAGEETGTGYAVTNNGSTYLVAERDNDGTKNYAIYKVLSIESESLNVIPLEEDNIPSTKKFSSAQEFTKYVIGNSTVFAYADKAEFEKGASSYTAYKPPVKTNNTNDRTYNNNTQTTGNILFKEDFQNSDNSWYKNYDFKDSNYIYINTLDDPNNHSYLFRNRKYSGGYMVPIPFYSVPKSNYSIEINAKHFDGIDNGIYGLKFGASGWENCYNFSISSNGYYRISKYQNDVYSELTPWTTSSALYTGSATNKLEVRVYSNYTEFYVNGQYLKRLDITPFGSTAGLEVYYNQTIYFDDLYIKSLSAGNNNYSSNNNSSSNILFSEDFQTYDNNWYSNYNFKDSNYIYISTLDNPSNHYYLFTNRKYDKGYVVPVPFNSIPNSYYSVEANVKHYDGVENAAYGIKFGGSDWDNIYNFFIAANGYYKVSKRDHGELYDLIPWTTSSTIYTGSSTNKLEVRVYITYADLYINGQYINRISSFSRYGNTAGLEVQKNQTVYFDDIVIKKL